MSDDVRADARRLLSGITPGPWVAEYSREQGNCVIPADARSTREAVAVTRLYHQVADAEFIAAAPKLVERLLAELDRVKSDLDVYVGLHEALRATFTALNDEGRLDDFACDELASDLNDGAFDENGREYQARLNTAQATLQQVRAQTEIPLTPVDVADVARRVGWDQAMGAVRRILDGGAS